MARVNLEEQLYSQSRKRRLARLLGYPEQMVIGLLAYLWHDSQDYEQIDATEDEIVEWARLEDLQDFEDKQWGTVKTTNKLFIESLIKSRFISYLSPNCYRISGNEGQISQIKRWKEKGKKAAEARWKRHNEKTDAQSNAHASNDAMPFNTIHSNTIQSNTIQNKEERGMHAPPDLAAIWNNNCGTLPRVSRMTKSRKILWQARWGEISDESYWAASVQKMSASNFCTGQNDRGWKGSVDFLLRPDTHVKIQEGKYDNSPIARRQSYAEQNESHLREMYAKVEAGVL